MDGGKIIGAIAIGLAVLAAPVWLGAARGVKEEPVLPANSLGCVEPREQIRKDHAQLLSQWREQVVRFGERVHHVADGRDLRIGLNTCLGCHGAASQFCDRCHTQNAVSLSCWQCHASVPTR